MRAWSSPEVPSLPVRGPEVSVHDTSTGEATSLVPDGPARMYVCGITPYDATHLGHANTFIAFDLLNRAWRAAGHQVRYVQNVTDIDDPLLERAEQTGEDWQRLAERETQLLRDDLEALRVLAPEAYVGAVESIPDVVRMVQWLQERGSVYAVEDDLYFSVTADPAFGEVSGWSRERMMEVFGDRGGDPTRPGKRDPLDCLVWQAERPGEPAWDSALGRGRPGWHVECSAIAREYLGAPLDVQGGGSDLVFPHHEMSASEAQVAEPGRRFARTYVHAGMVGYQGEKMSKSKGNLVLVTTLLREQQVDPMALRLALMAHHYRSDWEWTDADLTFGQQLLAGLRRAVRRPAGAVTRAVVAEVLEALADDLDSPRALRALSGWVAATDEGRGPTEDSAGQTVRTLVDGCLGVAL